MSKGVCLFATCLMMILVCGGATAQGADLQPTYSILLLAPPAEGGGGGGDGEIIVESHFLEIMTHTDVVRVPENGTAALKVRLSAPPAQSLTVSAARVSGDGNLALDGQNSITFDAQTWSTYQSLTLRAGSDADLEDGKAGVLLSSPDDQGEQMFKSVTVYEIDADRTANYGSHAGRITSFDGTATCLSCHEGAAMEVHGSIHYQWTGDSSEVEGTDGSPMGKLGGMNDFCIYPDINWLGKMTTADGRSVDGGCAKCHAGLGEKPQEAVTTAQLENIDCLICHAPGYARTLEQQGDGSFRFVPNEAKMPRPILDTARDIVTPGRDQCLTCHSKSGGGNNFKRGDIEEFHKVPSRDFDVHMASVADGGAGLDCIDCHVTTNHEIPGRGTDLRPIEGQMEVSCDQSGCHSAAPHGALLADQSLASRLDDHSARLDCATCHIPTFAKTAPTDMHRYYDKPAEFVITSQLYEPANERERNVLPVFRFDGGTSRFYDFGSPFVLGPNGRVVMSEPVGAVDTPGVKLRPFKRHQAEQAYDTATNRLLPLKMGFLFSGGDVPKAIDEGIKAVGWNVTDYDFVPTERYMVLAHGVAPKEQALSCVDCHDAGAVDFAGLGYTPTNPVSATCASGCHGDKTDEWSASELFERLHDKHVDDENYDCSRCHGFAAAY